MSQILNARCSNGRLEIKASCNISISGNMVLKKSSNKFSFENELTFAPKLNPLSLKLVQTRRGSDAHDIHKKEPKQPNDGSQMFTFQPVISKASSRIVSKLKTDFWERQNNLAGKQKKSSYSEGQREVAIQTVGLHSSISEQALVGGVNKQMPDAEFGRQGPLIRSLDSLIKHESDKEGVGESLNSLSNLDRKSVSAQKELDSKCLESCDYPSVDGAAVGSPVQAQMLQGKNGDGQNKGVDYQPRRQPKERWARHQEETMKDAKVCSSNLFSSNQTSDQCGKSGLSKAGTTKHYKSPTTDELDANHTRHVKAKTEASKAIQGKKVFLCCGSYGAIRNALCSRGWVEKYFKQPSLLDGDKQQLDGSDDRVIGHGSLVKREREDHCSLEMQDDGDLRMEVKHGIMAKVLRTVTPTLIWTLRRDDIDFKVLKKEQIVNHFGASSTFTTKAGLCCNLRLAHLYGDLSCDEFYPRCYVLTSESGKEEFIRDFRLTAAQNILKLALQFHRKWREMSLAFHQKGVSCAEVKDESECKVRKLSDSMSSTGSVSSSGSHQRKALSTIPTSVIFQAFKACHNYLESREHLDIEENYCDDYRMDESTWESLLCSYYELVCHGAVIADAFQHVEHCKDVLNRMKKYFPQTDLDGTRNIWIVKPGAKSRGRGIVLMSRLNDILSYTSDTVVKKETRWVVQKYIERPLLIHNTKFDIRQWFLVTDWNPLMLWFYQDSYLRFCGQQFCLDNYDAQIHLSNNSIQKNYRNGERSEQLPEENMWHSDEFKAYLTKRGFSGVWDNVIYPGMKNAIKWSLQCCQDLVEGRKNSFELYGADFMLTEDMRPWLIEINSSPALGPSTRVTELLCRQVIEDTFKVVIDRKENKLCDTGRFELAFKQPYIASPRFLGCNLCVVGESLRGGPKSFKSLRKEKEDTSGLHTGAVRYESLPGEDAQASAMASAEKVTLPMRFPATKSQVVPTGTKPAARASKVNLPSGPVGGPHLTEDSGRNLAGPFAKTPNSSTCRENSCKCSTTACTCDKASKGNNISQQKAPGISYQVKPDQPVSQCESANDLNKLCRKRATVRYASSVKVSNRETLGETLPLHTNRFSLQELHQGNGGKPYELLGTVNKLYVEQIDLTPGHGVTQIQNLYA